MKLCCAIAIILLSALASSAQCPTVTITGPAGVTMAGDSMTFIVTVAPPAPKLEYTWTVSAGIITQGQGTAAITVSTNPREKLGDNLTANVAIAGLPAGCNGSAHETSPIMRLMPGDVIDEWSRLPPNEERARFDAFFVDLMNNPANTGIVVLRVRKTDRLDARNSRVQFVTRHARFRKFDISRIWFVLESEGSFHVKVYRVPPGAELLPCNRPCKIIKGGDIK